MIMFRCASSGAITCFKNGFGRRRWKSLLRGENKLILLRGEKKLILLRGEKKLILLKREVRQIEF